MTYKRSYHGKNILITGVAGTVGKSILRELVTDSEFKVAHIIGIDNNESELFFVEQEFDSFSNTSFVMIDIRDRDMVDAIMKGVDIVVHAAANKHVILCEKSPNQAVATNIDGVSNLISAAKKNSVEKFIFTSSDKAVNPTNVMGTTKLMGERLVTAANIDPIKTHKTIFASTRFGNVLGSNGSVIPIFKKQILSGQDVTLTDPEMTRFVMSLKQSVELVLQSADIAQGGEVFVTKMPVVRISDLAEVMIDHYTSLGHPRVNIRLIGKKPGEKLYEELMSDEETSRALELREFFAVLPAFRSVYDNIGYNYSNVVMENVTNPYNSSKESVLDKEEILQFLKANELI